MENPTFLIHHPTATEYFFAEGCFITEWWNSPHDAEVSVARARVEPGATTRWHRLRGVTERYLILYGQGRVEVGDLPPEAVGPGAVALIPPGVRQRITNTGDADLVFLALCTPRFTQTVYEDLEPEGWPEQDHDPQP
jgi:mannose-6-phosphate isomerase-like protein (cupin superfamily)